MAAGKQAIQSEYDTFNKAGGFMGLIKAIAGAFSSGATASKTQQELSDRLAAGNVSPTTIKSGALGAAMTPVGPKVASQPASPSAVATADAASKPSGGSSAPAPTTPTITKNSQIDQNYFLIPNETTAHYLARTSAYRSGMSASDAAAAADASTGTSSKTTDTSTLDANTQKSIADMMASDAKSGTTDLNSGGSALASFSSALGGSSSGMMAILENQLAEIQKTVQTPPPSLVDAYNNLLSTSGIMADQTSLLNLETIMNGTVQDIRQEITAHGGFATESQIQAMASQRNFWLTQQANMLQIGIAIKQQYLNETMTLSGQDITNAQAQWQKKFALEDQLLNIMGRMQATDATNFFRFQNSQFAKLKFLTDSGALANASPDTLASFSMTTGIDMNTLQQAATNMGAKQQLSELLQRALLNERSGGGTPTTMADQVRNQKVTDYFTQNADKTTGTITAQTYVRGLQMFNSGAGKAADFLIQFDPSQYLTRDQIDALPNTIPELRTVKFNADLSDFVGAVQTGQVDSATAENTMLRQYPENATKIHDAFKNIQ